MKVCVWLAILNGLFLIVLKFSKADVTLNILHTNDVHSRFEEASLYGGRCPKEKKSECVGGIARHLYMVREAMKKNPETLWLNAGDYFQGTIWYYLQKERIVAKVVKLLKHTAMSLGNHEYDDGPEHLANFLEEVEDHVPVLCCNMDTSKDKHLKDHVLKASKVFTVQGKKVGVIGYLTPETKTLARTGPNVYFTDEIECLQKEAARLKKEGVNIIIALGHSGLTKDIEIAKKIPDIGLVVGGHSHSFLYTGTPPSKEKPVQSYPVVVERDDGSTGLVVQAFWFGKYMGVINVTYADDGKVKSWKGSPVLLDQTIPQDKEALELLERNAKEIEERSKEKISTTKVFLNGEREVCRMAECNLGNLITDSMLARYASKPSKPGWSNVNAVLLNGGGVRTSIDELTNNGEIKFVDAVEVLPFGNTIVMVKLTGRQLKVVMETSVRYYDIKGLDPRGEFLQVSGIRIKYDLSKPSMSRVVSMSIMCNQCRVPRFEPVQDDTFYTVAIPNYIVDGGDGYDFSMIPASMKNDTGDPDLEIFTQYLKKIGPVLTGLDNRITISGSNRIQLGFFVLVLSLCCTLYRLFSNF